MVGRRKSAILGQDSEESPIVGIVEGGSEEVEDIRPKKRKTDFHEREAFVKMASMAITANLYQASPGRDPHGTARVALEAAKALWEEYVKEGIKEGSG